MTVSSFARSDEDARGTAEGRLTPAPTFALVIAAAYLAAHLPFLARSLEDVDSINFALGLRDFDPGSHQPHPPGYPVYIGLGRVSLAVVTALSSSIDAIQAEALALSIWSALGGAVAIVAAWFVFRSIEEQGGGGAVRGRTSWSAALLLAVAPLFWLTGLRPMSDVPGLAAVLVAQALLLRAAQGRGSLVAGALATGIAAGLRSQTVFLTVPLLAWALVRSVRPQPDQMPKAWGILLRSAIALAAGVAVWAIPLIAATGGVDGYLRALGSQAGEDFGWVNMLWSNPTPRRLAFALYETFVLPWASIPLAVAVGVAAMLGAAVMLMRERRALIVLGVAFGPYAVFHLLFQDTPFVRYTLPVLPAVVWLAARGFSAVPQLSARPHLRTAQHVVCAFGLPLVAAVVSVPSGIAYGGELHPAFRAIADMAAEYARMPPAAVYSHFSLFRPLQAGAPRSFNVVPPARMFEWLGPVEYWRGGGESPVWFLADPRRTDLALIDPASRRDRVRYEWSVGGRPELQGTRPVGADWYRLLPPGWFAGEGWSLTAETGGLVRATAKGVDHRPIEAHVRRRGEPVTVMIGGRHLGAPSDPPAQLTLSLDGAVADAWTFDHRTEGPAFLRFVRLAGGIPAGAGTYAPLTIAARSATADRPTPEIAIRQFDLQSDEQPILGFGEGWHEDEYEVSTGLRWRWTSDRSILRVVSRQDVVLIVRGESPLKYFDAAPTVQLKAGARVLGEIRPNADFEWHVRIPLDALESAAGAVALEIDRVYLPGPAEGTSDTRRLGLRIFECVIEPGT